ncbi:hypothetical protein [Ammoniphilus sp. CFH 90114]|nr:hypothetical protein [Ammoniphilus sp. CFH 90114]
MRFITAEQMKLYDFERGYCSIVTYYKVFGITIRKKTIKWSLRSVV